MFLKYMLTSKEISIEGQGLTAVEKIFNKNAVGNTPGKKYYMPDQMFVLK